VIYLVASRLTPRPDEAIIEKYTWEHPLATVSGKVTSFTDVRVLVLLLVISLIILYVIFA
jgi:hypothetical protein